MDANTSTDRPSSPIVARLRALADELEEWAVEHRAGTLAEHEGGVLAAVRRALGPLLGAVVTRALHLDTPRAPHQRSACPSCARRRPPLDWRTRQPLTVCGAMPLARPYYSCKPCRRSWVPADAVLGLAAYQQVSTGLQAWLAAEGAETPFAAAASRIERLTGIGLGTETVRTHTETVGTALVAQQAQAATQVEATHEAAEPVDAVSAADVLLVETDGVMVPYRDDWHEMKVGLVAAWRRAPPPTVDGPPPDASNAAGSRLDRPSYVAARLPAAQFGPMLLAEAARRGALEVVGWAQPPGTDPRLAGVTGPALAVLRPVVLLGDGAKWIWEQAATLFGPERTEIVDWYHATQHLWALGRARYGPNDPHVATWVTRAKAVLWHRGATALLPHLKRLRPSTAAAPLDLQRERGYFTTNAARMAYPTFRAQGLPIGSGAVESTAGWLVQARLKRPGMRWSAPGAQAVAAVRAHLASDRPLPVARPITTRRSAA
jgi:hypothetical protein